ncbi:MAG: hypothetical protein ACRDST_21490 [Pseudonocardiaceae bacterium]
MMTAKAQLSGRPLKFVRATHVAVSAGWLGLVVAMLTLGISAATASHPTFVLACYAMMERIGGAVIPFFAVATLLTGIVLSVATPWQLLQYWWIVVKLVLAVAVIVTAVALTGDWVQRAVAQAAEASRAADGANAGLPAWLVVAGSAVHLLFLWAATTISVDKPWGKIKWRQRSAVPQREPAGVIGQH